MVIRPLRYLFHKLWKYLAYDGFDREPGRLSRKLPGASALTDVARALGAEHLRKQTSLHHSFTLRRGGLTFHISEEQRADNTTLHVRAEGLPPGLHIRPEGASTRVGRMFGRDDVNTADPAFDDAVWVQGPELMVLGALGGTTRHMLRVAMELGATVEDGVWQWSALANAERAARVVDTMVGASRSWLDHRSLAQHLGDIALADQVPATRARALAVLAGAGRVGATEARAVAARLLTPVAPSDVIAGVGVSPERVVAAALLLEVEGSPSDLGALRRSAGTLAQGTPERAVVDAAWAAVAARVSPGDAGALSIAAAPQQGELSRAGGGAGEVSLPEVPTDRRRS